jgi:lipoprotein-anchoring transpeptidase ErfK/SrfK
MPKRPYPLIIITLALFITVGWLMLALTGGRQASGLVALPAADELAPPSPTVIEAAPIPTTTPPAAEVNLGDATSRPFIPNGGEHWAEVSLGKALVTLYEGERVRQVFQMSYGRGDTPNTTTYPGLFTVYAKDASLHQSAVAGEYIRNWVGFDQRWANGFHSVIMDRSGTVIDQRLGQAISSGCIRTTLADSATIFAWLPYGAQVWVHD